MKPIAKGLLALLLIVGVVLGATACSPGNGSKLSQSDVDKLNKAIETLTNVEAESGKVLTRCAAAANEAKCLSGARKKMWVEFRSVVTVYETVAGNAHGDCQTALQQVARDMRSMESAVRDDSKPMAVSQKLAARLAGSDADSVLRDCNLKPKP